MGSALSGQEEAGTGGLRVLAREAGRLVVQEKQAMRSGSQGGENQPTLTDSPDSKASWSFAS